MPGMDTGGFWGATDCAARAAGSIATMKTICSANFQNECPVISNVLCAISAALTSADGRATRAFRPGSCLLLAASLFCLGGPGSGFLLLCIGLIRRNSSGKPQPGVARAGDTLKGRRSDFIALKILRRLNSFPLACYLVPWCGLENSTDLLDLNQPSSHDHSCQATRALKLVAQFAPVFPS